MQSIVVFIILAIAIGGFLYFGQFPTREEGLSQLQETLTQAQESAPAKTQTFLRSAEPAPKPASKPLESKPTISVNTYIVSGPKEGEIIDETNKVTFEFNAIVSPEETQDGVTFETKVEGLDDDWKETSSNQRTVNLPSGPKEYTFLVRAKIKDAIDPTPAGRTFKINTSPYFGKVEISSIDSQTSSRPSSIKLSTQLNEEEKINITGWQLRGNKGVAIITQGIETYLPYDSNLGKDIFIRYSDTIYLWGAPSPLGINKSFRPNKCFGYLTDIYNFFPSISSSKRCPSIKLEDISHLGEYCQDFILGMGACEVPDYSNNLKITLDSDCTSYISSYAEKNFNYEGCFRNYSKDKDFLNNYWYVYLGHDMVSKLHDTLYLRDQDGLLVVKYLY